MNREEALKHDDELGRRVEEAMANLSLGVRPPGPPKPPKMDMSPEAIRGRNEAYWEHATREQRELAALREEVGQLRAIVTRAHTDALSFMGQPDSYEKYRALRLMELGREAAVLGQMQAMEEERAHLFRVAEAAGKLSRVWDALCRCVDEFEPEDMAACAERRDDLDAAVERVIVAWGAWARERRQEGSER